MKHQSLKTFYHLLGEDLRGLYTEFCRARAEYRAGSSQREPLWELPASKGWDPEASRPGFELVLAESFPRVCERGDPGSGNRMLSARVYKEGFMSEQAQIWFLL